MSLPSSIPPLSSTPNPTDFVGPTVWSNWVIPAHVIAGAYPASSNPTIMETVVRAVIQAGVTCIVCLQDTAEYEMCTPYESVYKERNPRMKFLSFPICDNGIGEDDKVVEFVKNLAHLVLEGEVLYVHCWGGHGRTGTIVAILLSALYKISAEEALRRVAMYHSLRPIGGEMDTPETEEQRMQVKRLVDTYFYAK